MKTKTSLIATAATIALLGAANGQIVIDIAGSTAGRSTVNTNLLALISGESTAFYRTDGAATTLGSADAAIYYGGTIGGQAVTVRTFWAGSATGVDYVSNQVQLNNKFIRKNFTGTGQIAGTQAAIAANGDLAPTSAETAPEFGFSDVKQASTIYQTNALEETDTFVIPFKWVKTGTADLASVTNITNQQARVHYTSGGETKVSLFTGNAADAAKLVYAVGRDSDSGTRITAAAETGAGPFAELTQWTATTAGSGASVTLSNAVEDFVGFASGGGVATILGGTGLNFIGYVGISDAATAATNGGVELNFNGVPFSVENVKNGSYTYWSKYQMIKKQGQAFDATTQTTFTTLRNALIALATAGNGSSIKLTDMAVSRQADGANVVPN